MEKLTVKQPKLVNRDKPLLLHDNAKAHSAKKTSAKLRELGLETLPHPPYSPDLAPTDYHFFSNFDNFLRGRKFNSEEAVKSAFENFAFRKGLSCLPEKWQKCVDSDEDFSKLFAHCIKLENDYWDIDTKEDRIEAVSDGQADKDVAEEGGDLEPLDQDLDNDNDLALLPF
ncbi:hypothetical protein RvY_16798 [Ramazzottius varieornatus]|uniref:Tc1-like transposase DDE domain-containing protein n=1 Tax=Ramazzottius varieornatus TaxID=947166 RepID=A0A1D1VZU6_RAMVA|nr:hypothetical protein RvY_16798 [Ramazzottius varieornatus]